MFHSNKKKEKKALSEEEQKKLEEKLEKIKAIQNRILKMRKDKETDIKNLDFILKAGILMPDFGTMWSYRKELIIHQENILTGEEFYNFLLKEVENIFGIMMQNPKSYVLWYHRIWCLNLLSKYEHKSSKSLNQSCLRKEIILCNKFLEKDERNFHVWNYRLTIFKMIYQYFRECFWDFLKEELYFTLKMIKKSFSNFSAWHYRSKLITLDLVVKKISWGSSEILEYFKDDLFYIKNAIFTDPRDQSTWNYYNWILTNITPIFIKSLNYEKFCIHLKLSQKIPIDEFLELEIFYISKDGLENCQKIKIDKFLIEDTVRNSQSISELFGDEIKLDFSKLFDFKDSDILDYFKASNINEIKDNSFKVVIKGKTIDIQSQLFSEENLNLNNKICPLKNNIDFPQINFSISENGLEKFGESSNNSYNYNMYDHLEIFMKNQLEMIDDLIKNTDGFIENAHFRKAQLLLLTKFLKFETNSDLIKQELLILVEKSKRMKEVYKNMIEALL